MSEHYLPEDLMALERALAGGPEANDAFTERVMAEMEIPCAEQWSLWRFAGAVAAVVVLGVTFLLSMTPDRSPASLSSMQSVDRISSQIDQLQMGFSPKETRSMAACYSAAQSIPRLPPAMNINPGFPEQLKDYHKLMGD